MAADYSGNPVVMDTDDDSISAVWVQQILWVNCEAAKLTTDDQLTLTINGTAVNMNALTANAGAGAVIAQMGPFAKPVYVETLTVTLIEGGQVVVWLESHPPTSVVP